MLVYYIAMINYRNEKESLPANINNAPHTSHEHVP